MKNLILLMLPALMLVASCRTKKSTTDLKETKTEIVSITDNSTVAKNETVQENEQKKETKSEIDKSFFEAWIQIKSDEATFEDKDGNKWIFKNPQINQKSSQTNNIAKTEQTDNETNKVASKEENQQSIINATLSKQTKTDLQQSNSSKGKEPVWLYVVGAVLVGGLGYFILKRFKIV